MISIIIPTHNRRELLLKKLEALSTQPSGLGAPEERGGFEAPEERGGFGAPEERGGFEVIVVADGCTDDTPRHLNDYRPNYPFRVIYTDGKGAAFARNRGAELAQGDILLFSDDDVIPGAGWVEGHRKAHGLPRAVAVGRLILPPALRGCGAAELRGPAVFWWNITGNSTSLPKALFDEVGGYDESFASYGGEDPDLGYRLIKAGAKLVFARSAEAVHEAWDYPPKMLSKARAAGAAHLKVWRKHQDPRIAWALGIHPALLVAKLTVLPWSKTFLGLRGDFELAYAWGAWGAYQEG